MSKKIAFLIAFTSLFWLQFTKIDVPAGFTDESNIYKINYVIARGIFWAVSDKNKNFDQIAKSNLIFKKDFNSERQELLRV